jgi:hypothetical protein
VRRTILDLLILLLWSIGLFAEPAQSDTAADAAPTGELLAELPGVDPSCPLLAEGGDAAL